MFTAILATAIGALVAHAAFANGRRQQNWTIIKSYRVKHFIVNLPVVLVVLTAAVLLITYVPYFDKNPVLWVISEVFGNGDGTGTGNVVFAGLQWKFYALVFLPLLMFALPTLAKAEEESYRLGTRDWKHGIIRSVRFGLAHLIMLIPIGAAFALSIGGIWFTHHYFKGGVQRSTVYHAVYNTMLVAVIFVSIFILV